MFIVKTWHALLEQGKMWAVYGTGRQDGCQDFFFSVLGGRGTLLVQGGVNETAGWVGFCHG